MVTRRRSAATPAGARGERARRAGVLAAGALATAAAMTVSTLVPPAAAQSAGGPATSTVTLLNISDYHGRISAEGPSTVAFADTIEALRAEAGDGASLLLSAGDNVGATLFASSYKDDQPTIDVLNAVGLAASAVGNHEFDRGVADLRDRIIPAADWAHLAANVTVDGEQLPGYSLHEVAGLTVGVIGVVTEQTPSIVSPDGIAGVEFSDPVAAVNRVAARLDDGDPANGEADIIVAEYHEGAPPAGSIEVARARSEVFDDIVTRTAGSVDVIFTGHTHQLSAWEGERAVPLLQPVGPRGAGGGSAGSAGSTGSLTGSLPGSSGAPEVPVATRPVLQAGSYGGHIGRVSLDVDPASGEVVGHTQENVPVPPTPEGADLTNPVVAEVKDIVDAALAEAEIVGGQPVGTVTGDITTAYRDGARDDRLSESTLGNLVGQFFRDAVADRGGADLGFMNPGGLRADLMDDPPGREGNITLAEADAVQPFANTIVTLSLTGEQVWRVLEQQWQPVETGRLFRALGTSDNLSWTFDPTAPAGQRITSVTVDGAPLDPRADYRVAVSSFLASGGDHFTAFTEGADVRDTGLVDSEAWLDFLADRREEGIAPDFGRHAVAAKGLPGTVQVGGEVGFTLSGLDLTSLGAPTTRTATVELDGIDLGTFDAVPGVDEETFGPASHATPLDGRVDITVTLPAATPAGVAALTVTTDTGTVVRVPITVVP